MKKKAKYFPFEMLGIGITCVNQPNKNKINNDNNNKNKSIPQLLVLFSLIYPG